MLDGGALSMTNAETYRRYAAECLMMSHQRQNANAKAVLVQMATMWIELAEIAEKNGSTDEPPPGV
jgi:hypothetical protein